MATPKAMVCRCEDITLHDCQEAIADGYSCFEDLKRFLGVGTGPCQGKSCVQACMHLIAQARGIAPDDVDVMTFRPPVRPIPFQTLAAADRAPMHQAEGARATEPDGRTRPAGPAAKANGEPGRSGTGGPSADAARARKALPPALGRPWRRDHYQVVIIGGGAIGLSTAHELAKLGITDVLVLDRDSLVKGATGRNGGGVRAQWTTEENIVLARRSIEAFKRFAAETGHNIFLRQGGYLFLTRSEEQLGRLREAAAFQNRHGVRTRLITLDRAQEIVPGLDTTGCVGATFNPDDAVLFPWPLVWGWQAAARKRGVEVATFTTVTGLRTSGGRITHVETDRGAVACDWVVNASGAWAKRLSAMAGVDMPNKPERHEILVSEPLKPFLDPMLVDLSTGFYINQDMRGELVGGMGGDHRETMDWSSSLGFLRDFSKQTVRLLPRLGPVKVLRQWAGSYDVTPDRKPILGIAQAGPQNLLQASGFSGHGMMISPMVGRLTAQLIAGQRPEVDLRPFRLERFEEGDLAFEGMVIG